MLGESGSLGVDLAVDHDDVKRVTDQQVIIAARGCQDALSALWTTWTPALGGVPRVAGSTAAAREGTSDDLP